VAGIVPAPCFGFFACLRQLHSFTTSAVAIRSKSPNPSTRREKHLAVILTNYEPTLYEPSSNQIFCPQACNQVRFAARSTAIGRFHFNGSDKASCRCEVPTGFVSRPAYPERLDLGAPLNPLKPQEKRRRSLAKHTRYYARRRHACN
jgi:hypothetical protein